MKWLFSLFFAVFFLSGCSEDRGASSRSSAVEVSSSIYGDAVVEGSIGDASNLIPILATDSSSHAVAGLIYNGLLKYDENLILVGDLASKWEVSENNKEITFFLKDKVFWQDGEPFTAEDVKFTYELIVDNKTPTAYDSDFRIVDKIETPDNLTIKVFYKEAYAPALASWTTSILPSHLLKNVEIIKSPLQRKPIGTGPFKFYEWKPGSQITLVANDNYFEGRPYLDRYSFKIIPDTATMFLELLNGAVDLMSLSPLQFSKQTENPRFKDKFNKYKYVSNSYTYVGYNLKNPLFEDKRVRQALSYATPKQDVIDGVLFGLGVEATGPYKPGSPWHNPNVKKYPYDIQKAKDLLREAGYKKNKNGILEKDGKEFSFTIITNQGNSSRSTVAEILQQSWSKLGIKLDIRILEWATFINEYIDKRNFDAVILGWTIPMEPDLYDVWHSSNCEGKKLNFVCFKNEEFDEIIEKARREFDFEKRKQLYFKAQDILAEEQPYTFLYVGEALIALDNRFKNIKPMPAGLAHNLIKWYVPENKRKYLFTK